MFMCRFRLFDPSSRAGSALSCPSAAVGSVRLLRLVPDSGRPQTHTDFSRAFSPDWATSSVEPGLLEEAAARSTDAFSPASLFRAGSLFSAGTRSWTANLQKKLVETQFCERRAQGRRPAFRQGAPSFAGQAIRALVLANPGREPCVARSSMGHESCSRWGFYPPMLAAWRKVNLGNGNRRMLRAPGQH